MSDVRCCACADVAASLAGAGAGGPLLRWVEGRPDAGTNGRTTRPCPRSRRNSGRSCLAAVGSAPEVRGRRRRLPGTRAPVRGSHRCRCLAQHPHGCFGHHSGGTCLANRPSPWGWHPRRVSSRNGARVGCRVAGRRVCGQRFLGARDIPDRRDRHRTPAVAGHPSPGDRSVSCHVDLPDRGVFRAPG